MYYKYCGCMSNDDTCFGNKFSRRLLFMMSFEKNFESVVSLCLEGRLAGRQAGRQAAVLIPCLPHCGLTSPVCPDGWGHPRVIPAKTPVLEAYGPTARAAGRPRTKLISGQAGV